MIWRRYAFRPKEKIGKFLRLFAVLGVPVLVSGYEELCLSKEVGISHLHIS